MDVSTKLSCFECDVILWVCCLLCSHKTFYDCKLSSGKVLLCVADVYRIRSSRVLLWHVDLRSYAELTRCSRCLRRRYGDRHSWTVWCLSYLANKSNYFALTISSSQTSWFHLFFLAFNLRTAFIPIWMRSFLQRKSEEKHGLRMSNLTSRRPLSRSAQLLPQFLCKLLTLSCRQRSVS